MEQNSQAIAFPRSEYLDIRKDLTAEKGRASDRYDRTIVTVSGGALFISMAFLEKIVPKQSYVSTDLLFAGWICLAVALLCSLVSHLTSQYAIQKLINYVDKTYVNPRNDKPFRSFSRWLTCCLNVVSLLMVVCGVVLIVFFVHKQLP